MLTLLFYEPADEPPTPPSDVEHAVAGIAGVELHAADAGYRPGRWRDPATGAWCQIDLGEVPIERDDLHPPTDYLGWRLLGVAAHLPLACPHWQCVEALGFVEAVLSRLPGARALDLEDTRSEEGADPGPYGWSKPRVLASWERMHIAQTAGNRALVRMDRRASLALWRYRRERSRGLRDFPEAAWPEALALRDDGAVPATACSAALWLDASRILALPPVELLVVTRPEGTGVLPADELATAAAGGEPVIPGQARLIRPGPRIDDLFHRAKLLPVARFKALGENDWSD